MLVLGGQSGRYSKSRQPWKVGNVTILCAAIIVYAEFLSDYNVYMHHHHQNKHFQALCTQ